MLSQKQDGGRIWNIERYCIKVVFGVSADSRLLIVEYYNEKTN